jgi:hypothetical protein
MAEHDPLYGWEANRRRKLVLGLDATPEQRLDWLEEMIALAHASGALPRRRDYVIPLEGTIEYDSEHGRIRLTEASFVSTPAGELSFAGSWGEMEERYSIRLSRSNEESFAGDMLAPRQRSAYRTCVNAKRARTAPYEWEIRGTYIADGGQPEQLTLRLTEKTYG